MQLIKTITSFIRELYNNKSLIISLAVKEFRSGYLGSVLGMTWVFIEPMVYMFVMWFFFTKALKFRPSNDYPYVPWLMTSMILYNYFSYAFAASVGTFRSYSFLLKRQNFNISIMPVISILSALFIHLVFICILIVLFIISDISFSLYWFQAVYYLFALSVLLLGLAWITASISLFIKDVKNAVGVILQIGFWVSPIFWDLNTFPEKYRILLKLNPLTYVMQGYRKSFIYGEPFWNDIGGLIYFWTFTIIILAIGMITYKKLRPDFGDVI